MIISGKAFKNGDTCHGVSYSVPDTSVDLAEIIIDGRYPEGGWAQNRLCHEMVKVLRGSGTLVVRDGVTTRLEKGDVVHVPPGEQFAWSGDMTIIMACSPPFDPGQYEIELIQGLS